MTTNNRGRIAVVSSRYGGEVLGGAEAVLREIAHGLHARGWDVEVLTSTARDLYTFADELPRGTAVENGITVKRFPAVPSARGPDHIGHGILARRNVSVHDQLVWMNTGARMPSLFEYLVDNANQYRALICGPYMSWTAFVCAEVAASRTILHPCLHDEPFAYLDIFKPMFEGVRGIWFLTEPELELARELFELPRQVALTGSGVTPPASYDPDGFRRRHGIAGEYLLYAGRREWMKGWDDLMQNVAFSHEVLRRPVTLVTCGRGAIGDIPVNAEVIDVGFLEETELASAMAAARAYVQPSALESFSRTIMEAWLAGTVVIANEKSAVVTWHCERSGAGLTYRDRYEFAECLRISLEDSELAKTLALRGRDYVLQNYQWPAVLDAMERTLMEWS